MQVRHERVVRRSNDEAVELEVRVGDGAGDLIRHGDPKLTESDPPQVQVAFRPSERSLPPGSQLDVSAHALELCAVCPPDGELEVRTLTSAGDEKADTVLGAEHSGEREGDHRRIHGRWTHVECSGKRLDRRKTSARAQVTLNDLTPQVVGDLQGQGLPDRRFEG
jgi:hypothetical protein